MTVEHGHEGVRVSRRWTLRGAFALPTWLAVSRSSKRGGHEPDDVKTFLDEAASRAAALAAADDPNEEAHLHELCARLARLDPAVFPKRKVDAYKGDGTVSGPVHADGTFLAIEFVMEPGAVIRAHNHVGYCFVSYGLGGETTVRHFHPEPGGPDPSRLQIDFAVREVSSQVLTPGRTSTLTRTRGNIHEFVAGDKGARFVDFGIHFADAGDGPKTFSVLDLDEAPRDAARRVYTGRWIGNIYAKGEK